MHLSNDNVGQDPRLPFSNLFIHQTHL
eukprot:COSAG06_NODE_50219_length_320_cov_0.791855_1_plen_26_part_10